MRKKSAPQRIKNNGFIRIISGQFRGRKLPVNDLEGLRPTTDRVKETVFNWLMQDTRGANVLDCFAGSGGLGFECLSRFAAHATFIELNKKAAEQLKNNANTLKLDNTNIINTSAIEHLTIENQGAKFNLVFVDPPFRKGLAEPSCHLLELNDWLADEALIYVEVEKECTFDAPENWQVLKEKQAGQVLCRLYQRN
ncbi:16S rRNA (guanine(966)-N(2))-methyltransferase RsmD [Pseudoalteromonas sp. MTN2-4]|uniref:16S rRNA (guanine(966)-N(2))-methyltransferase RsmD n=1 Tax=Pseudoalteromonas sp. MTN2-4 TaxID=3056555 RepID=UPI0036F2C85C